ADPNFFVTHAVSADGSSAGLPDLAGFDLVIAQETFDSNDDIFKPGSMLGVKDVNVPVIYNKTWAFRSSRAITDGSATVVPTQNVSVTTRTGANAHPLLRGIDFTGGN